MHPINTINIKGHFEIISLENGREVWRSPIMANLVLNAGIGLLIAQHAGTVNSLAITSLEIGKGTTPVAASQTALANMIVNAITPARFIPSPTSLVIEFFVVDGELPDDTYTELGLRAGATLYTRALFASPYTKVTGRDTIIRYTLSYSAV